MSILASLARAYDRLPNAPPFGYAAQNVHGCIVLNASGAMMGPPVTWGEDKKGKLTARRLNVPYFGGRSGTNAPPYFLWDNSAYVLGVSAKEGFDAGKRFAEFKAHHLLHLEGIDDEGLRALSLFLEDWTPAQFRERGLSTNILDRNFVFRFDRDSQFLHERPAAKTLWTDIFAPDVTGEGICLVTGERKPIARIHPPIATFENPARIVSFDKGSDAFSSYGHVQAENAPTGMEAAFAYTTALNRFLERGSGHRIQIGDASTVFWADAENIEAARTAEGLFGQMFEATAAEDDSAETKKIANLLERMRRGEPLESVDPKLTRGVRFHVLGLAPNAARISIRFYYEDDFGQLAENYQRFVDDMRIEPSPREPFPPLWRYLVETAVLGKRENVPPVLPGEWMRSILGGTRYPLTLLSTVLSRIRADGEINALRVGIMRALLVRNFHKAKEAPVSLDPDNREKGYLLGRLFAAYEYAQTAALGRNVNATIKDKFYGSASATPRAVFPVLDRGSANHLSKIGKERPGQRVNLERAIAGIMDMMSPAGDPFPASLPAQDQALFGLGYYHQRSEFFRKRETAGTGEAAQ